MAIMAADARGEKRLREREERKMKRGRRPLS
jgi:hypothetical protein